MNRVTVLCDDRRFAALANPLKADVYHLLRFLKRDRAAVSLFLLPPSAMRRINRRWHAIDRVTNVLSFCEPSDFISPPRITKTLGDIYLCPSYLAEHQENIRFMVIHGLLHLVGYDHTNKDDRRRMERAERRLCQAIGVPWPYAER